MKTQSIIAGISIAAGTLYLIWSNLKKERRLAATTIPSSSENFLPVRLVQNDKLVLINDIDYTDLQAILKNICDLYNKENYQILTRVYKVTDKEFVITFPFDIAFEIFCYFINYVHYPEGFDKSMNVTGWTTIKIDDSWIAGKAANKKVMLYVPTEDSEYDNVFMTTNDNISFKLGFGMKEGKSLDIPARQFVSPTIEGEELANKEYKDFK